jgi:hypothetical protein
MDDHKIRLARQESKQGQTVDPEKVKTFFQGILDFSINLLGGKGHETGRQDDQEILKYSVPFQFNLLR